MHKVDCICKDIPIIETRTHVALIIHKRELSKVSATGPLALSCLPNSRLHVHGKENQPIVETDLIRHGRRPLLLYPSENSRTLTEAWLQEDQRPIDLLVPDGNWRQAARMPKRIEALQNIECIQLPVGKQSQWGLRHEPKANGLATFEAIARALGIIESVSVQEQMENVFATMVGRSLKNKQSPPPATDASTTTLNIIYQDDHMVVVNKPSGLAVHRGWERKSIPVLQILRDQLNKYLFPVHRLDKATSGALVFAFDEKSAQSLQEQFQSGIAKKTYLALCRGNNPDIKTIDHPLSKVLRRGKISPEKRADTIKRAHTTIELLGAYKRYGLYAAKPETGRTHQIRRHMKHVSHPIIGDVRYGKGEHNRLFRERFGFNRLALHCTHLSIKPPNSTSSATFVAPVESSFYHLLSQLNLENELIEHMKRPSST